MSEEKLESAEVVESAGINVETVDLIQPEQAALLNSDPDYLAMVEAEKSAKSGDDEDGDGTNDGENNNGEDDDNAGNEDGSADGAVEGDGSADSTVEGDDSTAFEDNVLPGLSGKDFEKLDEPIREVIAQSRVALDEVTKKATEAQARLDTLLKDPIVAHREQAIANGENGLQYKVPEMSAETIEQITELVDQGTPEAKEKINELVKAHIDSTAEIIAENAVLRANAQYERKQDIHQSGEVLVKLAKLAKIDLPSQDPDVIAETNIKELGVIGEYLSEIAEATKSGIIANPQKYLNRIGAEGAYAQMAMKHGWPLLKNADGVINKQIKAANKKFSDRFLKGNPDEASGSFARSKQIDQNSVRSKTIVDGVDTIKLATNDKYHNEILYSKPNDPKWADKVAMYREMGEQYLEDNPNANAPQSK